MTVAALSTAGLSQYVSASTNVAASQQAFQALQQSLASGNLTAAQSAFNSYQAMSQSMIAAIASSSSSSPTSLGNSELSTDLAALGGAISSGNLKTAQSAFATVQNDLKSTPSQEMTNAESAVAQTVQWVDDLLSLSGPASSSSTPVDAATAILDSAYGLNSSTASTDPTTSMLESAYGDGSSGNTASATPASPALTSGNTGSGASINAYA
jgi:hypothetical protein